jgi:hypothetical protein
MSRLKGEKLSMKRHCRDWYYNRNKGENGKKIDKRHGQ